MLTSYKFYLFYFKLITYLVVQLFNMKAFRLKIIQTKITVVQKIKYKTESLKDFCYRNIIFKRGFNK